MSPNTTPRAPTTTARRTESRTPSPLIMCASTGSAWGLRCGSGAFLDDFLTRTVEGSDLPHSSGDRGEVLLQNRAVVARHLRAEPDVRVPREHRVEARPDALLLVT